MKVTITARDALMLTPGEVADLFKVDPKTVTRWARAGRLTSIRTPGGHRRFSAAQPVIAAALAYRDGGAS